MPKFAVIFAIAMLSSAGLPLLNGFVGEFTILQGAFEANPMWAAFAELGGRRGDGANSRHGLPASVIPGEIAGRGDQRQEPDHPGHDGARGGAVCAADRVVDLDRDLSQALLRYFAAAGGGDRGARPAGLLRGCGAERWRFAP